MVHKEKRNKQNHRRNTATRRVSQRSRARRRNDNRVMIAMIIGVVAVFSTVIVINIAGSNEKLKVLKAEKAKLEAQYNEQLKLSEELEEKEVYVKTNAYIEEQARKIGLVYPDEVIFKPED